MKLTSMKSPNVSDVFSKDGKKESSKPKPSKKRMREDSEEVMEMRDEIKDLRGEIGGLDGKLELVLDTVGKVMKEIEGMRGTVGTILKRAESHEARLKSIEDRLNVNSTEVKGVKTSIGNLDVRINKMNERMEKLEKNNKDMMMSKIELEARSRRNNLLFFGVKEQEKEDASRLIHDIIKKDLGLNGSFPLQRAHRLGPVKRNVVGKSADRPRPIIVNFLDFRDKETVRSARSRLQAPISVQEDFPEEVRKAMKSLMPELIDLKNKGKRVTLAYPAKLISDGKLVREASVSNFIR